MIYMNEEKLKIGKKGEIFTTKKIRKTLGLKPDTYVLASVIGDKLIIRKIPNLDELLNDFYTETSWDEVEKLSEKIQKGMIEHD